jgi:hypothetical protein
MIAPAVRRVRETGGRSRYLPTIRTDPKTAANAPRKISPTTTLDAIGRTTCPAGGRMSRILTAAA